MKLKLKKIALAKKVLLLIEEQSLVEELGGQQSPFYSKLLAMSRGEDIPYDEEMEWFQRDSLTSHKELFQLLSELSKIDFLTRKLKWIPWI